VLGSFAPSDISDGYKGNRETFLSVYRTLFSVQRALSSVCRALLSVYRALFERTQGSFECVYRALLSVCWAHLYTLILVMGTKATAKLPEVYIELECFHGSFECV